MKNKQISKIKIGKRYIGEGYPAYIISEVGSNFDGSLKQAKYLAKLSKDLGADAYKIQNFTAPKIVSSVGFKNMKLAFQSKWKESVVDVYRKAEFPREWVKEVSDYCKEIGIDFFSSPYDTEAVDMLEKLDVPAHKIGSGEIDNYEFLQYVAKTGKPIIIGCGAATMEETGNAIAALRKAGNNKIVMLQCVTNYPSKIADANINAMLAIKQKYNVEIGYSDHTVGRDAGGDDPLGGITVPLAAVALGARVIEKHFTDDRKRKAPDSHFAMDPEHFGKMIESIRALEKAMGDSKKNIMPSEKESAIIQRRGMYAARDILKGQKITREMIEFIRPAISIAPPLLSKVLGSRAKHDIKAAQPIRKNDVSLK